MKKVYFKNNNSMLTNEDHIEIKKVEFISKDEK